MRRPYETDLTDEQWGLIAGYAPPERPGGRDRTVDTREVINAILSLTRTRCQWRLLPYHFPPSGTVSDYYRRFREACWMEGCSLLGRGAESWRKTCRECAAKAWARRLGTALETVDVPMNTQ